MYGALFANINKLHNVAKLGISSVVLQVLFQHSCIFFSSSVIFVQVYTAACILWSIHTSIMKERDNVLAAKREER